MLTVRILGSFVEYSFKRDDLDQPIAQLNMEAEAFGHWLSIEMTPRHQYQLDRLREAVAQLLAGQRSDYQLQGMEFSLQLNRDQVLVQANTVAQRMRSFDDCYLNQSDYADIDLDDHYVDSDDEELSDASAGLVASCGLEDFRQLISAWSEFIGVN